MRRLMTDAKKNAEDSSTAGNFRQRVGTLSRRLRSITSRLSEGIAKLLKPTKRFAVPPWSTKSFPYSTKVSGSKISPQPSVPKIVISSVTSTSILDPGKAPPVPPKSQLRYHKMQTITTPWPQITYSSHISTPPLIPERSPRRQQLAGPLMTKVEKQTVRNDPDSTEAWLNDYLELLDVHPSTIEMHESEADDVNEVTVTAKDISIGDLPIGRRANQEFVAGGQEPRIMTEPYNDMERAAAGRGDSEGEYDVRFEKSGGAETVGLEKNESAKDILGIEVARPTSVDRETVPQQLRASRWSFVVGTFTGVLPPNSWMQTTKKPRPIRVNNLKERMNRAMRQYKFQSPIKRVSDWRDAYVDKPGEKDEVTSTAALRRIEVPRISDDWSVGEESSQTLRDWRDGRRTLDLTEWNWI